MFVVYILLTVAIILLITAILIYMPPEPKDECESFPDVVSAAWALALQQRKEKLVRTLMLTGAILSLSGVPWCVYVEHSNSNIAIEVRNIDKVLKERTARSHGPAARSGHSRCCCEKDRCPVDSADVITVEPNTPSLCVNPSYPF